MAKIQFMNPNNSASGNFLSFSMSALPIFLFFPTIGSVCVWGGSGAKCYFPWLFYPFLGQLYMTIIYIHINFVNPAITSW